MKGPDGILLILTDDESPGGEEEVFPLGPFVPLAFDRQQSALGSPLRLGPAPDASVTAPIGPHAPSRQIGPAYPVGTTVKTIGTAAPDPVTVALEMKRKKSPSYFI